MLIVSPYYLTVLIINLYCYNTMGSPTKEKFREGVQQEILTNYYMSRYDKVMSRMNEKKV